MNYIIAPKYGKPGERIQFTGGIDLDYIHDRLEDLEKLGEWALSHGYKKLYMS